MRLTQTNWKSGGRLLSLALLGGMTFSPAGAVPSHPPSAYASPAHTWLLSSSARLCRTSSAFDPHDAPLVIVHDRSATVTVSQETDTLSGAGATTQCAHDWTPKNLTRAWSDARGLVPMQLLYINAIRYQPAPKPAPHRAAPLAYHQPPSAPLPVSPPSGTYSSWVPVPGHPGYGMSDFAGDPWSAYFGYCTWYAWYRHQDEPLLRMGNAAAWAWNAAKFGLRTGSMPVVGATVVFQPGVEGAGGGGHVAHVEVVLGGGWFIVSEMNFGLNGGGWGRVDWRYAYVTSGVTFIY